MLKINYKTGVLEQSHLGIDSLNISNENEPILKLYNYMLPDVMYSFTKLKPFKVIKVPFHNSYKLKVYIDNIFIMEMRNISTINEMYIYIMEEIDGIDFVYRFLKGVEELNSEYITKYKKEIDDRLLPIMDKINKETKDILELYKKNYFL